MKPMFISLSKASAQSRYVFKTVHSAGCLAALIDRRQDVVVQSRSAVNTLLQRLRQIGKIHIVVSTSLESIHGYCSMSFYGKSYQKYTLGT